MGYRALTWRHVLPTPGDNMHPRVRLLLAGETDRRVPKLTITADGGYVARDSVLAGNSAEPMPARLDNDEGLM